MRRKLGLLLMIFGTVLLIGAMSLLVYNYTDNKRAGKESETVLSELHSLIEKKESDDKTDNSVYIYPKNDETPAVELDGKYYIGILSIP
ncbi:MAG: hypothetical protein LUH47_05895, partial [Clostridiales bacterium]|nr:hypothetical protein [Clostridiales bacterium]